MFIWGTDLARHMAPLTRIFVLCVGPVSNKKFFPYLLLLSSSFKSLQPYVILHLYLCDLKPSFIPNELTFPFLLFLSCSLLPCLKMASAQILKITFYWKQLGKLRPRAWFRVIGSRPYIEIEQDQISWLSISYFSLHITLPPVSHLSSLPHHSCLASGQIQPSRVVLWWGSLHCGLKGTMGLLEMKLINSNA